MCPRYAEHPERRHRRLRDEDRPPVERLREHAAERGPEREPERPGRRPARAPEHRQRARQEQRGADALDATRGDQEAQALRGRAGDRGGEEEPEPGSEQHGRAQPVHEQQQRQRGHRDREVVGGHDPRDAFDRGVEPPVELGQRQDDDRGVRERDRDRGRERPAPHVPQVSCGAWRPGSRCQ